jgi:hypothetical protein
MKKEKEIAAHLVYKEKCLELIPIITKLYLIKKYGSLSLEASGLSLKKVLSDFRVGTRSKFLKMIYEIS